MLRLKNIVISHKTVEADYSPENSGWWGHIIVDLDEREILSVDEHPEYGASYKGHAFWKLLDISECKNPTSECTVMWY